MDSSVPDDGKLFVGGIAWDTTEDAVRDYFSKYGEVTHAVIIRDKTTNLPRGFGFVVFSDPTVLQSVLQEKHTIDGRPVEAKRAVSRDKQQGSRSRDYKANGSANLGTLRNFRTKKIFVGGLPSDLTKVEFTQYFRSYGEITDAVIMIDQGTGRSRGFGFITFDTEDAVDRVLNKNFHELSNKLVEVKRALPKESSPANDTRGRTSNGYGYNGATANVNDLQMESRGSFPLQPAVGGYPLYSGFEALRFGYGIANNSPLYGGLGAYAFGSYESPAAGYMLSAFAYGDQTVSTTGLVSSAGLQKTHWGSQAQAYGALAYGLNAGYGVGVPWSIPVSNATIGQPPQGTAVVGTSSIRGSSEAFQSDSGKSRTTNRERKSNTKSNAGQSGAEAGHHRAGGEGAKGRTC